MKVEEAENCKGMWTFNCPACGCQHYFWTSHPDGVGPVWQWDGNVDKPTVSPSLRVGWESAKAKQYVCHFFIRNGKIEYCSDSSHAMAGKTVEMEELK